MPRSLLLLMHACLSMMAMIMLAIATLFLMPFKSSRSRDRY